MRKNFGVRPYTYPQPVFIVAAYGEDGVPNAMNAAWGGVSEENQLALCLANNRRTVKNILARKAFTVSMGTAEQVKECDYVGVVSGNRVKDKLDRIGWHTQPSQFVDAPVIEELPMTVECKFLSYCEETCILLGEIVNVSADERVLTDGKIDPKKLRPILFDPVHNAYLAVGERVGSAFSDGLKLK